MFADIDHPDWPVPTGHNRIRKCAGNTLTGRTQKCWDDLFTFTTISSTARKVCLVCQLHCPPTEKIFTRKYATSLILRGPPLTRLQPVFCSEILRLRKGNVAMVMVAGGRGSILISAAGAHIVAL